MNTPKPAHTANAAGSRPALKQPYTAPRLIVHGTVAELTAAKWTGQRLLAPGYLTEA